MPRCDELTDEQWVLIEPLSPQPREGHAVAAAERYPGGHERGETASNEWSRIGLGNLVIHLVKRSSLPILVLATYLVAGCASAPPPDVRSQTTDRPALLALDTPRVNPPAVNPPGVGQTATEDYRIGPQDLVEVQVYGLEGLKREVRVNSRGMISLPLIGTVTLGGLTSQQGEELITAKYEKDYLRSPQVSLFIKEFTSQRITVEGAVNRSGIFPIKGQTTLLQALAIAGGGAAMSDMTAVTLFRAENGSKRTQRFDVDKIRTGVLEDPVLLNDDLVVVNRSPARTAIRDSLFRDILDTVNPFNYVRPY